MELAAFTATAHNLGSDEMDQTRGGHYRWSYNLTGGELAYWYSSCPLIQRSLVHFQVILLPGLLRATSMELLKRHGFIGFLPPPLLQQILECHLKRGKTLWSLFSGMDSSITHKDKSDKLKIKSLGE